MLCYGVVFGIPLEYNGAEVTFFIRRKVKAMRATVKYDKNLKHMHTLIPLAIYQKLVARAKKNHRSINGEAISIIEQILTVAEQQEQSKAAAV